MWVTIYLKGIMFVLCIFSLFTSLALIHMDFIFKFLEVGDEITWSCTIIWYCIWWWYILMIIMKKQDVTCCCYLRSELINYMKYISKLSSIRTFHDTIITNRYLLIMIQNKLFYDECCQRALWQVVGADICVISTTDIKITSHK